MHGWPYDRQIKQIAHSTGRLMKQNKQTSPSLVKIR